jgi:hypothetical protein
VPDNEIVELQKGDNTVYAFGEGVPYLIRRHRFGRVY